MPESLRDRVARVLNNEGAFCGNCGREPGGPIDHCDDCDDCNQVLSRYADALIAAGLVAEFTPDDFEVAATAVALEEGSISAPKGGRAWRLASAALNAVRNYREVTS